MTRRGCSCCKSCKSETVFFDLDYYAPKSVTTINKVSIRFVERVYRAVEKFDQSGSFESRDETVVAEYEHSYEDENVSAANKNGVVMAGITRVQPRGSASTTDRKFWRNGNLRQRITHSFVIVGDGTSDTKAAFEYDLSDAYDFGTKNKHGFSNVKRLRLVDSSRTDAYDFGSQQETFGGRSFVTSKDRSANKVLEIESKHNGLEDESGKPFDISYSIELDFVKWSDDAISDPHSDDQDRFRFGATNFFDSERIKQDESQAGGVDIGGFVESNEVPSDLEAFQGMMDDSENGHNTIDEVTDGMLSEHRESRPHTNLGQLYDSLDGYRVGLDLTGMETDGPSNERKFILLSSETSTATLLTNGTLLSLKNEFSVTPISTELSEIRHERIEDKVGNNADRVKRRYLTQESRRPDGSYRELSDDRHEDSSLVSIPDDPYYLQPKRADVIGSNWRTKGWIRNGIREFTSPKIVKKNTEINFTNVVETDFFSQTYRDVAFGNRENSVTVTFSDPETGVGVFAQKFTKSSISSGGTISDDLVGIGGDYLYARRKLVDGTFSSYRGSINNYLDLAGLYSLDGLYLEYNFQRYGLEQGRAVGDFTSRAGYADAGVYSIESDGIMQLVSEWVARHGDGLDTMTNHLPVKENGFFHWPLRQGILSEGAKHYYDFDSGISSERYPLEAAVDGDAYFIPVLADGFSGNDSNNDGILQVGNEVYNATERRALYRLFDYADELVMHYIGTEGAWGEGLCQSLSENPFNYFYQHGQLGGSAETFDGFGKGGNSHGNQNIGYMGCETKVGVRQSPLDYRELFYSEINAYMIPTRAKRMINGLEDAGTPYVVINSQHRGPAEHRLGWSHGNELIADGEPGVFGTDAFGDNREYYNQVELGGLSAFRVSALRSEDAERCIAEFRDIPSYYETSNDRNDFLTQPRYGLFIDGRPADKVLPLDQSYRSQYSSTNNTAYGAMRFRVRDTHVALSSIQHIDKSTFDSKNGDAYSFKPKKYPEGYEFKGLTVSFKVDSDDSVPKAVWFDGTTHYEDLPESDDPSYGDMLIRQSKCENSECNNIGPHTVLNYDVDSVKIEGQDYWRLCGKTQYVYDGCTFYACHDLAQFMSVKLDREYIEQERSTTVIHRHFAVDGSQALDSGSWGPKAEPEWFEGTYTGFNGTGPFDPPADFTEGGNLVLERSNVQFGTVFGLGFNNDLRSLMALEGHEIHEAYSYYANQFGDTSPATRPTYDSDGELVLTQRFEVVNQPSEGTYGQLYAVSQEYNEDLTEVVNKYVASGNVGSTEKYELPWRTGVENFREVVSQAYHHTTVFYNDSDNGDIDLGRNMGLELTVSAVAEEPNSPVKIRASAEVFFNRLNVPYPANLEDSLISKPLFAQYVDPPTAEEDQFGFTDYLKYKNEIFQSWFYAGQSIQSLKSAQCNLREFGIKEFNCFDRYGSVIDVSCDSRTISDSYCRDLSAEALGSEEMELLGYRPWDSSSDAKPFPGGPFHGPVTVTGQMDPLFVQVGDDVKNYGGFVTVLDGKSAVTQYSYSLVWDDIEIEDFDSLDPPDLELLGSDATREDGYPVGETTPAITLVPFRFEISDDYNTAISPNSEQRRGGPGPCGFEAGPEFLREYDYFDREGTIVELEEVGEVVNMRNLRIKLTARKDTDE